MRNIANIILLLIVVLVVGCSTQSKPNSEIEMEVDSNVPFEIINGITFSKWSRDNEPQRIWFNEVMNDMGDESVFERFEHGDKTYILISSGLKNSGGYDVLLRDIHSNENIITFVVEDRPPQSSENTAAMENPVLLMSIERTNKEIQLKWYNN
jgi:hypothetical protein